MEEVIAKSVRKPYIVLYSVALAFCLIIIVFGIAFLLINEDKETDYVGYVFLGTGLFLAIFFGAWLIHYCRMKKEVIKFSDGKLYFNNGIVCSPTEVDYCKPKSMGLDGAMFNFGKLIIAVNGKEFKLKFVDQPEKAVNRLFILKAEYTVKEHIAQQQTTAEQPVQTGDKQEEENG